MDGSIWPFAFGGHVLSFGLKCSWHLHPDPKSCNEVKLSLVMKCTFSIDRYQIGYLIVAARSVWHLVTLAY